MTVAKITKEYCDGKVRRVLINLLLGTPSEIKQLTINSQQKGTNKCNR